MKKRVLQTSIAAALAAPMAKAVDVHITSETIGQGYELIRSNGDVLRRSRLHQYLGLNLYDLAGNGENNVFIVSQFRFDTDFGITDADTAAIPNLQNNHFSLQYLYVEARDLGWVDLRVGRQLVADDADYTMFDGALVTVHFPVYLGFDVLAGTEVKNAGYLESISTTQFELDGDGGYDDHVDEKTGIVIGSSLYTDGLRDHHAKIGWRRIMTTPQTSPLGGEQSFVDMEKLFGSYHVRAHPKLHLALSGAYDLVSSVISDGRVEVRVPDLGDHVDLELAYWFFTPTFEGSSIFNIFQTAPLNDVDFRVRYRIDDRASTYLGAYTRFFRQGPDGNDLETDDLITDWGIRGGGKMQLGETGRIGLDAFFQTGYGDITTLDLYGGYGFLDDTLDLSGRLTTVLFDDDVRDLLEGTSVGAEIALSYRIRDTAKFILRNEINSNDIEKVQYRVYGLVDLSFWL